MVKKLEPKDVEAVPDEHVEEIYRAWFDTCLPDQVKESASRENIVLQHKFAARLLIAQWGLQDARKIVAALPLSPEHDGSRHKSADGSREIRRDLTTARMEGGNLIDFWDSRR